jgi:hypothetical protein
MLSMVGFLKILLEIMEDRGKDSWDYAKKINE